MTYIPYAIPKVYSQQGQNSFSIGTTTSSINDPFLDLHTLYTNNSYTPTGVEEIFKLNPATSNFIIGLPLLTEASIKNGYKYTIRNISSTNPVKIYTTSPSLVTFSEIGPLGDNLYNYRLSGTHNEVLLIADTNINKWIVA